MRKQNIPHLEALLAFTSISVLTHLGVNTILTSSILLILLSLIVIQTNSNNFTCLIVSGLFLPYSFSPCCYCLCSLMIVSPCISAPQFLLMDIGLIHPSTPAVVNSAAVDVLPFSVVTVCILGDTYQQMDFLGHT